LSNFAFGVDVPPPQDESIVAVANADAVRIVFMFFILLFCV
jgi:hypothetical protein